MEHLTLAVKTATIADQGTFTAIAAAWTPDRQGDRIIPGAFAKTIAQWQASGKYLPVHFEHRGDADQIVGHIDPATMRETDAGLYVEGKLDLEDSAIAREAWRSIKANRMGMSVGYLAQKHRGDDGLNHLTQLDLFEVSITAAPASPDTRFLSVKALPPEQREVVERELEMLHRTFKEPVPEEPAKKALDTRPIRVATFEC
jgi:Escherichia/Staphylococcus phage prohead protease